MPYTDYLLGLAEINQSVSSQMAVATTTLASNRNLADQLHDVPMIAAAHTLGLAEADAVKTHERKTADVDRSAAVADAAAAQAFDSTLSGHAATYAEKIAAAERTRDIATANAEKTLAHEQADGVADAMANYTAAITTAQQTFTTTTTGVRKTWWTREASSQSDLLVAQSQAERDWFVQTLTADKVQIVSQNSGLCHSCHPPSMTIFNNFTEGLCHSCHPPSIAISFIADFFTPTTVPW